MSSSGPFEVDKIVSLWTKLLELQVDIGYYPNDNSISFLPPEGRAVDETLCRDLRLTAEVISLLNRLPFPSNFDEAYDTTIFYESMAVPFTDDEWIRKSRDPERCFYADEDMSFRSDFLMPGELALVLAKDEPGYNLILDTRANTARLFVAMIPPYNSGEEGKVKPERLDYRMHYRNYPARSALEVLKELVGKFRDLEWIPLRNDEGWPDILTNSPDEGEGRLEKHRNAKNILREQFGWPDNFDKERWDGERTEIVKQILD